MPEASAEAVAKAVAEQIVKSLSAQRKTIAAAESCTGGMAADLIVCVPGASKVFWGSFVSYTEDAKNKMLGIPGKLIEEYGAVSRETAVAMAEGAIKKSGASLAFSVTGLAGPESDGTGTSVGTVWIAVAESLRSGHTNVKMFLFNGDRNEVREKAAIAALEMVLERINNVETSA